MKRALILRLEVTIDSDDFGDVANAVDDLLDGGQVQELIEGHVRDVLGVTLEITNAECETEVKP